MKPEPSSTFTAIKDLEAGACRERREEFGRRLAASGADVALLTDPRHLMYLCNAHGRSIFPAAALIERDGSTLLSQSAHVGTTGYADSVVTYEALADSTWSDDRETLVLAPLLAALGETQTLAVDVLTRPWLVERSRFVDAGSLLRAMRRSKATDEVAVIHTAVRATEQAYAAVTEVIRPGVSEIDVFCGVHDAAVKALGEPIGELGNDFRGGAMGGDARREPLKAGDMLPLDVGVVVRHYNADLCRTFAVSGSRSSAQQAATERVIRALSIAEGEIRAGVSCRALFDMIHAELDGFHGWGFPHHLGHGIGLDPHESPRINAHSDDVFAVGDVFTLEPGLYGEDLSFGVRIEQNYVLTEQGLERLSSFDMAP